MFTCRLHQLRATSLVFSCYYANKFIFREKGHNKHCSPQEIKRLHTHTHMKIREDPKSNHKNGTRTKRSVVYDFEKLNKQGMVMVKEETWTVERTLKD